MKAAVADLMNNGTSVKHSACVHGIPRLTLRRHVKIAFKGCEVRKKLGRPSVISAEQEAELVSLVSSRLFNGKPTLWIDQTSRS